MYCVNLRSDSSRIFKVLRDSSTYVICHVKCIFFEAFPLSCSLKMSVLKHFLSYRNFRVQICEVKDIHLVFTIFIRLFTE